MAISSAQDIDTVIFSMSGRHEIFFGFGIAVCSAVGGIVVVVEDVDDIVVDP